MCIDRNLIISIICCMVLTGMPIVIAANGAESQIVEVRLTDGADYNAEHRCIVDSVTGSPDAWQKLCGLYSICAVERTFTRPEEALRADRLRAETLSGRTMPDLTRYVRLTVSDTADLPGLIDALKLRNDVAAAYPIHPPAPLPSRDTTPDFTPYQEYLVSDREGGPEFAAAWPTPGARGTGITVADIEYNCNRFHEDLDAKLGSATAVIGGEPVAGIEYRNHGTATAGLMVAEDNGFGITGIAPDSMMKIFFVMETNNIANAIDLTRDALQIGDIILIEMQVQGPNYTGVGQKGLVPVEYDDPVFDVIEITTALGLSVVEPAGNGSENLDDPIYEGKFDPSVRNSGAVIVGAGVPFSRAALRYSNTGMRVNLHGWGELIDPCCQVWSTGYGDAPESPAQENQWYTDSYSGTSSAAAMVAGAMLCVQGAYNEITGAPVMPADLITVLTNTGIPQGIGGPIGPLPDTSAAIATIDVSVDLQLSKDMFLAGDPFLLRQETRNPLKIDIAVISYLILDVWGELYFWDWDLDTFTENTSCEPRILNANSITQEEFLDFLWPDNVGSGDNVAVYYAYLNMFEPVLVGNIDVCVFGWR